MTLLYDMANQDHSIYLDSGNDNYLNLFNSGKIAMLWTGPWDISSINAGVQYGVQILPGDVTPRHHRRPRQLRDHQQRLAARGRRLEVHELVHCRPKSTCKFAIATGDLPLRESETKLPDYTNGTSRSTRPTRCSWPT